jgi:GNAT superfamily N-acetyltransferase
MKNEITTAAVSDLDSVAEMFDLYRQFYRQPADVVAAKNFLADRIHSGDSVIFISRQGNDTTGFVQCYPVFTSIGMKRLWLLNDLYVKEKFRGLGISRLLISRCKQLARETQSKGLMLETEMSNTVGNKLYPREGFVINETSNFYMWTA